MAKSELQSPSAMADDDDDDFFGDFKFAETRPSYATTTATATATATNTTATIDPNSNTGGGDSFSDDGDDDWGDFVTTRSNQITTGFELSNGTNGESAAAPSRVKPRGALPLSLFGEAEEEEESGAGKPTVGDGAPIFFRKKDGDDDAEKKKGSALNGGVGISDLLSNLYDQSQQVKVHNGADVNSNVSGADSNSNESGASVDGQRSSLNESNWRKNGFDSLFHDANQNSNNLDSDIAGIISDSNGLSSNFVEQSENLDDDDDDDGWEFKGANADKQEQVIVELPGTKVETAKERDTQVDGRGRVNAEETGPTIGFSKGASANGPVDISTRSDDAPHRSGDWNFVFDFNQSSTTQADFFWESDAKSNKNNVENGLNFSSVVANGNANENLWQFKDSFSDVGAESKSEAAKVAAPSNLGGQAVNGGGSHGATDFFAASEGPFHKHQEWDFALTFNSSLEIRDGIVTDIHFGSKNIGRGVSSSPNNRHDESDDSLWEFRNAFLENGLKNEGESVPSPDRPANIIPPACDDANQGNEIKSKSCRESLPLSIFGEEEVETDAPSIQQDVSVREPASYTRSSNKAPVSNLSINDLIASLYSQAQQSTSLNDTPKVSENNVPSTTRGLESDLPYDDDDFDDDSWEFKDASLDTKAQNQSFATHFEDSTSKYSTKLELNDYVDFYCKLKDATHAVAFRHFENLKKAQSTASVFGEEWKLEALGEEIQKFHDQLYQETMTSELRSENLSPRSVCLSELLKVLEEPKFRVLESEYHLSNQLSLAEKDLGSAIDLSRHVTSTLRILKLGSAEEQSTYVSTWSNIVSVCAQELRHGALIWKQALQKKAQGRLLAEPQGLQYIIALGEIYRVVQVLRASAKLYKPWVLLDSEESVRLFLLLNECITLWSTSGFDEALQSISETVNAEFDGTLKELVESMKYIHDLDALAIQSHVFSGNQPLCRLSMLTAGIGPGLKMVVWDGEYYLLKLANLWANLITSNHPDLPHLNVS